MTWSRAAILASALVLLVTCAAVWPAKVAICLLNKSKTTLSDFQFHYERCDVVRDSIRSGELDECTQRVHGSDDGATLSFVDGNGVQKQTDIALYLSHGDYGAYYVIIQDDEVIVGPPYRNGLFSILRDRPICSSNESGDTGYTRIKLQ